MPRHPRPTESQRQQSPPLSRMSGRWRRAAHLVTVAMLLATLATATASPASALAVSNEAELRAAVADPNETVASLTQDIFLVCPGGDLERNSATPLLVEGNGFAIVQTCLGNRIISQFGGGSLTFDEVHLTDGTAVGVGGAVGSDGPVTITGGSLIEGNSATESGGAVYTSKSITVIDSTISDNQAGHHGGALAAAGSVHIQGSTLNGNEADVYGGAVTGGAVTISDSTFANNQAVAGGAVRAWDGLHASDSSFTENEATVGNGGAISLVGTTGALDTVTFERNEAAGYGGAVGDGSLEVVSSLDVVDSLFIENDARSGGAIHISGPVSITSSDFEENEATAEVGGAVFAGPLMVQGGSTFLANTSVEHGGAIFAPREVAVSDTEFADNRAGLDGGAIYATGGQPALIESSIIRDNEAIGGGGGIVADGSQMTISDSSFRGNNSGASGGAVLGRAPLSIERSAFANNGTPDAGGAISGEAPLAVATSTFTENVSTSGAGAIAALDDLQLTHVTAFDNDAPLGGSIVMLTAGSVLEVRATLLHSRDPGSCLLAGITVQSLGYNRANDASCLLTGVGDVEGADDPQLASFADNGGPTWTMLPQETSPLIDAVPAAGCLPFDQRGFLRPSGDGCDIGAVEVMVNTDDGGLGIPPPPGDPGGPGAPGDEPGGDESGDDEPSAGVGAEVVGGAEDQGTGGTLPRTGSTSTLALLLLGLGLTASGVAIRRLTTWSPR